MQVPLSLCPCCSGKKFKDCCAAYIEQQKIPAEAEQLMRSRYTAYTQSNINYIIATMQGPAAQGFDAEQAKQWASETKWLGLEVRRAEDLSKNHAVVEFIARYQLNDKNEYLHEVSEFRQIEGRWFYINGKARKVERNAPCPCGSGKKYKQCCQ